MIIRKNKKGNERGNVKKRSNSYFNIPMILLFIITLLNYNY